MSNRTSRFVDRYRREHHAHLNSLCVCVRVLLPKIYTTGGGVSTTLFATVTTLLSLYGGSVTVVLLAIGYWMYRKNNLSYEAING